MVFQFDDFSVLTDFLIDFMFGSEVVLAIVLYLGFVLYMTMSGVPLDITLQVMTPLLAAFAIGGWLNDDAAWLFNASLVVVAITFAISSVRIYSQ